LGRGSSRDLGRNRRPRGGLPRPPFALVGVPAGGWSGQADKSAIVNRPWFTRRDAEARRPSSSSTRCCPARKWRGRPRECPSRREAGHSARGCRRFRRLVGGPAGAGRVERDAAAGIIGQPGLSVTFGPTDRRRTPTDANLEAPDVGAVAAGYARYGLGRLSHRAELIEPASAHRYAAMMASSPAVAAVVAARATACRSALVCGWPPARCVAGLAAAAVMMRPRVAGRGSCPAPMRGKIACRRQEQAQAHEGTLAPVGVRLAAGEAFERVTS
jgi:hypothetical protein